MFRVQDEVGSHQDLLDFTPRWSLEPENLEVADIKDMVLAPEKRHMSLRALAVHAQRKVRTQLGCPDGVGFARGDRGEGKSSGFCLAVSSRPGEPAQDR